MAPAVIDLDKAKLDPQSVFSTPQEVIDFVGSKIARFKRPHAVVFTDALPRGADGAVDRDVVKARWGETQ